MISDVVVDGVSMGSLETYTFFGVTAVNESPITDASPDQSAAVGDNVFLDGSKSEDADDLQAVDSCNVNFQLTIPGIRVARITMDLKQKGQNIEASAYVKIVDDAGRAVKESTIVDDWTCNGNPLNTATASTRRDGVAKLFSEKVRVAPCASFVLEIIGASESGYTYDPSLNTVTGDTITVP